MSSSLRNHRVIIASLFLPNTIVLGPDEPEYYSYQSTIPHQPQTEINVPDVVLRLQKDKNKPVLTSQISSAHPHLPSSALGTPSTPSVPTAASAAGTGVVPTLKSTAAAPVTSSVKSIVQDLKDRTTARKTGGNVGAPLTPAPLRSPTAEHPFSKPGTAPGSVNTSGGTSGTATPGLVLRDKHATSHGVHHHRSPLSRMGSAAVVPQTDTPGSATDIPIPPLPMNAHRTLSRRNFRRKSSTALSSSYSSGSGRSKSKRRTPGVGSTASISSVASMGSTSSATSILSAEGLDTPSYPDDLVASILSTDSQTFYDDDEGHGGEEIGDEDEFHIEPNSHCNAGLKNAVDSVSPWPSFTPGATFMKMGTGGTMSTVGSGAQSPQGKPALYPISTSSPASTPGHGHNKGQRRGMSFSTDLRDRPLRQKLWVGTLGTRTDDWNPALREKVEKKLREEHENQVVWVEDGVFEGAYDEFCHQVLWPTLHYAVPDAPRTKLLVYSSATSKAYRDYVEVNRKVAEKIKEVYREGDVVWVNDYHLMLVPRMLRALGIGGAVGFFLHVSFPSSEILRCLPVRIPLLRGLLGADLVGFQTANLARHFRQTCGRVLGVEALPRGVVVSEEDGDDEDAYDALEKVKHKPGLKKMDSSSESDSDDATSPRKKDPYFVPSALAGADNTSGLTRFVSVGVFPMGIDVGRLKERRKSPEVEEWVQVLKSRYKSGKNQKVKLVVGRDKLDDIQGVKQKVQAFELFLEKHPEWVGKVILIQIALPSPPPPTSSSEGGSSKSSHSATAHFSSLSNDSSASTAASTDITSSILSKVAHINSKWSSLTYQPIIFLHTAEVDWNQYLALLSVADAFLVTSLREGMALRTHEFVAVQEGRGKVGHHKVHEEGQEGALVHEDDAALSDQEGTLILSEFTGSYSYSGFRSCIAINPWDTRGTADAIHRALTMGKEEARSRWEELSEHVDTQTAQAFVRGFLGRCVRAAAENRGLGAYKRRNKKVKRHGDGDELDDDEDEDDERTESEEVDTRKVKTKWKHANRRLIFVDWEGTLVGDCSPIPKELEMQRGMGLSRMSSKEDEGESSKSESVQNEEIKEKVLKELGEKDSREEGEFQKAIEVLKKLSADPKKNEVWVLSGLPVKGILDRLEKELGGRIGIVAENGCFIKTRALPSSSRSGSEQQQGSTWLNMVANLNMTWKTSCLEILNYFTERTPGSFVEERAASVVWRFWTGPTDDSPDRQWARRQAAEAQNHIFDSLGERYGLRIIPGTNSFLVLPNNISRSSAVGAILHPGGPARSPLVGRSGWMSPETDSVPMVPEEWDFVLAVSGDEKLLRRLGELDQCETVTISTSGKGTDAKWRTGRGRVDEVLGELASA